MTDHLTTLFVGLGSPHGDDQIGWRVADWLASQDDLPSGLAIRKAAIPLDVLDWLEDIQILGVCDALETSTPRKELERWEWNASGEDRFDRLLPILKRTNTGNSHDYQLAEVLDLAGKLDRLPPRVVVWGIPAVQFQPGQPVSEDLQENLPTICEQIRSDLTLR